MKKRLLAAALALTMAMPLTAMTAMTAMTAVTEAQVGQEFEMPSYNNGQYPKKNKVELITLEEAMNTGDATSTSARIRNVQSKVADGYEVIVFKSYVDSIYNGVKISYAVDGQPVSIGELHRFDHTGYMAAENALTDADYKYGQYHFDLTWGYPLSVTVNGVTYDRGWIIDSVAGGYGDPYCYIILILPAGHNITAKFRSADVSKAVMRNGAPIGFSGVDDSMGVNVQLRGTSTASTQPQSTQTWVSDASGWRVQNADGSYLMSQWFQYNNQWYYLGANGYMLTNTTTPDGYPVNADGVWIQ